MNAAPRPAPLLVAEDSATQRALLLGMLRRFGHEVTAVESGEALRRCAELAAVAPRLLLLDWEMPGLSGPDVCRVLRRERNADPPYILLVTARTESAELAEGLGAGVNDYIKKPFDPVELKARVDGGLRMLTLQDTLRDRVRELEAALARIRTLEGIIPICMFCHAIRIDRETWQRLELYLQSRTDARFSHGLCPDCAKRHYGDHYPGDPHASPPGMEERHGLA